MIINNMIIIMMTKQMHCQTGGQAVDAPTGVLVMCAQPSRPVMYICVDLCICIFIYFVFSSFSSAVVFSCVSSYIFKVLCLFICVLNLPYIRVYLSFYDLNDSAVVYSFVYSCIFHVLCLSICVPNPNLLVCNVHLCLYFYWC